MISYDQLPLDKDILTALQELQIEYVFQPIFYPDGKTIFAREALMRPKNMNVIELISKYEKADKLHVIEVATFFGALQAHKKRGYDEWVSINSFPSECMEMEEAEVFRHFFNDDIRSKMIVEILEYPFFSEEKWKIKDYSVRLMKNMIALDDYGVGINDMNTVEYIKPDIVKLDRSLISDIDKDEDKQSICKKAIEKLHDMGKKIVAEGVETKEEFSCLVSLGADLFQGYYLARPE